ncbi:unnamed protein product [Eruca vesicaria subsp. sativa]|uniref:C2H2-type domain-containing protein n=1 Tax=Eruca vesicaria subsp. sativa TaxID=29727 RepID=A0ABC8JFU2_ERUVS|nr:unnamed protein product [Eruca vesicaria subsp. sativa]
MMKNVSKATPEYATSETLVWWDMDSCPLPNGYDPSQLGPRINTELKNLGYNGPLTIIALGNLDGIPHEFLNVLSSNGFIIKHSGYGMYTDMSEYFVSRNRLCQPPPVTIILISGLPGLMESVTYQIYVRPDCGYNLLLAYPPHVEPKQPHPSSFVHFGSSNEEKETRRLNNKGSGMPFSCGLCYFFCPTFEDFTSHLQSDKHTRELSSLVNWKPNQKLMEMPVIGKQHLANFTKALKTPNLYVTLVLILHRYDKKTSANHSKCYEMPKKVWITVSIISVTFPESTWLKKEEKMMKNVSKATPEYATSETLVWWDMDSCPLPSGYDPSRLGPRIDTELKNLGYNGPLTLIALGDLDGIPYEFLEVLSSNGFVIKHSGYGMYPDMSKYFVSRNRLCQPPPVTIMLISGLPGLMESLTCEIYVRPDCGYNLLLAYPPHVKPKQPHPSSFVRFGGEWLWSRASLLKGSSNEEKETRRLNKGSGMQFSCGFCNFFRPTFEDFINHLQSDKHTRKVAVHNGARDTKFKLALKELEADKLSEHYLDQLWERKSYFNRRHKHLTSNPFKQSKAEMSNIQKVASSLPENSTSKTKKAKNLEVEQEFESSLPKNTIAKEQSKSKMSMIQGEYMALRGDLVL